MNFSFVWISTAKQNNEAINNGIIVTQINKYGFIYRLNEDRERDDAEDDDDDSET